MKQHKGFTLIELVVVIAVLAILAAIALPKFAEISDSAHRSSVEAAGGAYVSSVALVRAQWLANGVHTEIDNLAGYGEPDNFIDVSVDGWPTGVNGNNDPANMSAAECDALWDELMTTNSLTASTSIGADYLTTLTAAGSDCRYTYQATASGHYIDYDPQTGDVHTTLLP